MEGTECAEIGDLCSVPDFDEDVRVKYCYTVTNTGTFTDTIKVLDRCFVSEGEGKCFDLLTLIPEEDRTLAPGDELRKCEQVTESWCDGLLHKTCVYADATIPEFEGDCKAEACYELATYTPPRVYRLSPEHGRTIHCDSSYHGLVSCGGAEAGTAPIKAMVGAE